MPAELIFAFVAIGLFVVMVKLRRGDRCKHDAERAVFVTYSPPVARFDIPLSLPERDLPKALLGVTTVLLRCPACGRERKEEMLGMQTSEREPVARLVPKRGPFAK